MLQVRAVLTELKSTKKIATATHNILAYRQVPGFVLCPSPAGSFSRIGSLGMSLQSVTGSPGSHVDPFRDT